MGSTERGRARREGWRKPTLLSTVLGDRIVNQGFLTSLLSANYTPSPSLGDSRRGSTTDLYPGPFVNLGTGSHQVAQGWL